MNLINNIEKEYFLETTNFLNESHRVSSLNLLTFRITAAIIMAIAIFQVNVINHHFMTNFIYLTLWGAFFTYFYFSLAVIENITYYMKGCQFYHDNLWKIAHLLFIIAYCLEVPIALMFWGYIFPQINITTFNDWMLNIMVHGISCVLILIDLFLNNLTFYWKQLYIIVTLSVCYLITNFSYVMITDKEIYPGINWQNFISYFVAIMTFIVVVGVFALGKLYYDKVKSKYIQNGNQLLGNRI